MEQDMNRKRKKGLEMTRKEFIASAAAASALAASSTSGKATASSEKGQAPGVSRQRRPNILMIVTDQERAHVDLPKSLSLPQRERLMDKSVALTNFHVTTTPCSPSRSVIYTGQHTKYTGVITNAGVKGGKDLSNERTKTIGSMLREQGYYTAYKGKWHLSPAFVPPAEGILQRVPSGQDILEEFGFSDFSLKGEPPGTGWGGFMHDREIASEASHWMLNNAANLEEDQPWFLAVNLINPHDIMFFDAEGQQRATRTIIDIVDHLRPAPQEFPYTEDLGVSLPKSYYQDDLSQKPLGQGAYRESSKKLLGNIGDEAAWYRFQNYYFNCLRDVDVQIGVLLDNLERSGFADNTIVVFSSDHGEMAGAHGLREKGPYAYRENVRVPFVVKHPGIKGSSETSAIGSALDVAPTLLGFSGLSEGDIAERYPQLNGVNLMPAIGSRGGKSERDARGMIYYMSVSSFSDPAFTSKVLDAMASPEGGVFFKALKAGEVGPSSKSRGLMRGIFDGRYKMSRYFGINAHQMPATVEDLLRDNDVELYDTQEDPDEITNLVHNGDEVSDILTSLNNKLNEGIRAELYDGDSDDGSEFS